MEKKSKMKKKKIDPIKSSLDKLNIEFTKLEKELPKPLEVVETKTDKAAKVVYMSKKIAEQSITNLEENVSEIKNFLVRNKEPLTVGLFIGGLAAILYKSIQDAMRKEAV